MNKKISVMVAAYNEEKNLSNTVKSLIVILEDLFSDYEILIFDDCSLDRTYQISETLAKNHHKIKVIHNKRNKGLGYNYREAFKLAKYEYFFFVPGDGAIKPTSIKYILENIGQADIIIPYTANPQVRPFLRRIISSLFTTSLNLFFRTNIRYYNGIVVHKTNLLKSVRMDTNSFAYQAEILIKLIKRGYSYKELPMYINIEETTSMFKLKNILGVFLSISRLFVKVMILRDYN